MVAALPRVAWMLLYWSSGGGRHDRSLLAARGIAEDLVSHVALEAANNLRFAHFLDCPSANVIQGWLMFAYSDDNDAIALLDRVPRVLEGQDLLRGILAPQETEPPQIY